MNELEEAEELKTLLAEEEAEKELNLLNHYQPYDYQKKFHNEIASQRLLMAGNRVGKSFSGAMEMAFHTTGLYPKWWKGKRFNRPVRAWAGGVSNETTRDVCQKELLGQPDDPGSLMIQSLKVKAQSLKIKLARLLEKQVSPMR